MSAKGSKKQRKALPQQEPAGSAAREWAIVHWVRTHAVPVCFALAALGTLRIIGTYSAYSHTSDEFVHIACGMQWLDKGIYRYEAQHPPLARVAAAIGPYLAGIRSQGQSNPHAEGAQIVYHGGEYDRNLSLARAGILPFFWIAALVVFLWARRGLGDFEAVLAVFLFTFLPPVLAHAGLATTDMALAAFVAAAFYTAVVWLEHPGVAHSALFGACVGLAVLSKFSALPFLPAAMAAALAWYIAAERPGTTKLVAAARRLAGPFGLAVATGALVIWAGYRFRFGPVPFAAFPLPAADLYAGIRMVMDHVHNGHPAYLLGSRSEYGWWYYYPVILLFKTPLPFLALLGFGAAACRRRPRSVPRGVWLPLAYSLGILLFALTSDINIGVRHVLPVYIGFAIVAAAGAARMLEMAARAAWTRWTLAGLLVWMAATSLFSHPEYLPYFNALAGDEPEKIAVDSDLDWGQDMKRLGRRLQEVGARQVAFTPAVLAYLEGNRGFGYPPITPNQPDAPSPGWNAVSLTVLKSLRLGLMDRHPEITPWPEKIRPNERIGKGIWLYYFPPR